MTDTPRTDRRTDRTDGASDAAAPAERGGLRTGTTRRRFLAAGAAVAASTAVAGCSFSFSSTAGLNGNLVGISPSDGSELWTKDTGEVQAGPTVVDGTLYAGSRGTMYALSPGDGGEQWTAEFEVEGLTSVLTPTVVGDTVLVPVSNRLVALSASDGSEQWRFDAGDAEVWAGPTVAGGTAVVGAGDAHLYGVSVADGSQQWHFTDEQLATGSETVASGTVYLNSLAGRAHAISLADGTEQWTFETEKPASGGPAVGNGTVYVGTKNHELYAVAAADGTEKWSVDTSGGALNVSTLSPQPTFVDGYVYVVANTVLHGIDADTRETWSQKVRGSFSYDVAGDAVYLGANLTSTNPDGSSDHYGTVFAYDRRSGGERWLTVVDGNGVQPPTGGSDAVYAGQGTGKVFALAKSDGSERWVYEGDRSVRGSPIRTDDAVVVETA